MTRGLARLKYLLILLARMLAVGGAPDTAIIVLDRSASMEQRDPRTGQSKRSAAVAKVSELLESIGRNTRLVLIENTENDSREIDSTDVLADLPQTGPSVTSADIPAMMQTALEYVTVNETGRTVIWICSDLHRSDWDSSSGRWDAVREGFAERDGVRFYLLSYPRASDDNVAVTVSGVHRRQTGNDVELVMDVQLRRESNAAGPLRLPLQLVINGARTEFDVEMTDHEYLRQGHTIPIDRETQRGWGRVELPNDSNLQDNVFHFVFAEPPVHHTAIVSDEPDVARVLRIAAATPSQSSLEYEVEIVSPDRVDQIHWDQTGLLLWQSPIPDSMAAQQIENFVARGGTNAFARIQRGKSRRIANQKTAILVPWP